MIVDKFERQIVLPPYNKMQDPLNEQPKSQQQPPEQIYKESPYRFIIFSTYILASLVNSLPVNTFSATTTIVQKIYGIPSILVTLNYLICPISHAILAFPVNWMLTKKGIRISYYIAAVLMIVGIWLRTTLSADGAYLCLLGSFLCGGSGLILMNSASKITMNWFRSEVMTVATFGSVLATFVSMAASLGFPGLMLDSKSTVEDFDLFLKVQAIIVTVPFILLVIFIKEKPKTPPSKAAEVEHKASAKRSYKASMKLLFKNKNYLRLAASMALSFGVIVAHISVFDKGLKGLGYAQPGKYILKIVSFALIFGIIGTFFYSFAVKKTKQFKKISLFITFGLFIGYVILICFQFQGYDSIGAMIPMSILFGFNYFSEPSFFVVYGAQLAFPVDQASVAGYIVSIAQTFGFIAGIIYVSMFDGTRENAIIIFVSHGVLLLIGALIALTVKEDLRKQRFENTIDNAYTPELSEEQEQEIDNKDSIMTS